MSIRLVVGAVTDVGLVRDHNEDGYLVDEAAGLLAVADGMGGHRGGEVASATALSALRRALDDNGDLGRSVGIANDTVFERSLSDRELRGMGTTLTAGLIDDAGHLLIGHVGDSRAYLWRDHELRRLTTDHSLVAELIAVGELSEEEAERDPRRSMITRALGLEPNVAVDLVTVELVPGDRIILCSDGLTSMVRESEAAAILAVEPDPARAARHLVEAANAAGGVDNTTVVVADIAEADSPPPDSSEPMTATLVDVSDDELDDLPDEDAPDEADDPEALPPKRRWWRGRKQ